MRDGDTALVTGASRGIGRAIAERLAGEGANVVLAARSDGVDETAARIDAPDRTLTVECDVTDEDAVAAAVTATVERFDGLDAVVNNAGVAGPTAPVEEVDRAAFERTLATNLTGPYLMVKHAASHLRTSDRGGVVNVSSVGGKRPYPNRTAYAASKMGLIGLTRTLAFELGDAGVTVNAICPGPVAGPRIERVIREQAEARDASPEEVRRAEYTGDLPLSEMVTAEEVAAAVAFLLGEGGRHVTAQDLNVDSGMAWY